MPCTYHTEDEALDLLSREDAQGCLGLRHGQLLDVYVASARPHPAHHDESPDRPGMSVISPKLPNGVVAASLRLHFARDVLV
jgi:hypothetical protein